MSEVAVVVSDPWSFVDEQGSSTFTARVRATDGELMLLVLEGQPYVATPRGAGAYNLVPVTEEQTLGGPPWDRDQWRGQPDALVADLREI